MAPGPWERRHSSVPRLQPCCPLDTVGHNYIPSGHWSQSLSKSPVSTCCVPGTPVVQSPRGGPPGHSACSQGTPFCEINSSVPILEQTQTQRCPRQRTGLGTGEAGAAAGFREALGRAEPPRCCEEAAGSGGGPGLLSAPRPSQAFQPGPPSEAPAREPATDAPP